MNFFIKKLLHQELGYYRSDSNEPGVSRGQYFLISKKFLEFFPPLSKDIPQDLQFLNLVSHDSNHPAQAKYIYDNDKFHGSTASSPRNEHRINLNMRVNPDKKIYLKDDIIIFKKEIFLNEYNENEVSYIVTRYRKSIEEEDYNFLSNLLQRKKISQNSQNYCFASELDLSGVRNYRDRLFNNILPKDIIIIPDAENILDLNSKEGIDLANRINRKTKAEQNNWEIQLRRIIFKKYNYSCSVTDVGYNWFEYNNKTEKIDSKSRSDKGLEGAHIKPRAHNGPYTQDNIIPLIAPVHRIFDRGLFTIDENLSIKVHPIAKEQELLANFHKFDGKKLFIPNGINLSKDYISWHSNKVFGNFSTGKQIRSII